MEIEGKEMKGVCESLITFDWFKGWQDWQATHLNYTGLYEVGTPRNPALEILLNLPLSVLSQAQPLAFLSSTFSADSPPNLD